MSSIRYRGSGEIILYLYRIITILALVFIFLPKLNPARVSLLVGKTQALVTSGLSFKHLSAEFIRPVQKGWVQPGSLYLLFGAASGAWLGILVSAVGAALSLGEIKIKRLALWGSIGGSAASICSGSLVFLVHQTFEQSVNVAKIQPVAPSGLYVLYILNTAIILLGLAALAVLPRTGPQDRYEMQSKYRLFLMMLPFLILTFMFSYLPLWGWAVSFFDYRPGFELTAERFVGFKWFTYLFENEATKADVFRVVRNTLVMSGLGIATSWLAMAFAIFLSEMKSQSYRRVIQTLTTIPNFISWVLVYSFALALFASEGFINSFLMDVGLIEAPIHFLQNPDHVWLRMLAWGMWKGLGWSAIIYIASITGIDPQLYEAAVVDGAGRFDKIRHITIPSLMPTYFVLLLLMIAGILNNGMEQYFVFKNAINKDTIEVLDLYVYTLGLTRGGASNIALATVVGLMKSLISVTLLFVANRASKMIRGVSIV